MKYTRNISLHLSILALCIVLSIIALFTAKKIAHTKMLATNNTNGPDFFMTNITLIKFDASGHIYKLVQAHNLRHFEQNNTYHFTQPEITLYHAYEKPWHINAKYASSETGKTALRFWDHVKITRAAGKHNTFFDITTNELWVYPEIKFATTSKPITIIQNDLSTKSIGAAIDLHTGIAKLISQTKTQYQIR